MKRYFLAFLAVFSILSLHAVTFQTGGIYYDFSWADPNKCVVTYPPTDSYSGDIVIPDQVKNGDFTYDVVGIGQYAFAGASYLSSVTLPASATIVGRNAFEGCSSLKSVEFPSTVTEISEQTFYECKNLREFRGPGITKIGYAAFSNCISLSTLEFSDSLSYIDDSAFLSCSSLQSFLLPNNVTLGPGVFRACTALESISLPSTLTNLPDYTFSNCVSLSEVEGSENLVAIGANAFNSCYDLADFKFGNSLQSIGAYAFAFAASLDIDTVRGDNLIIGDYAFTGCTSLKKINLTGVREIGVEAYANDTSLEYVNLDETIYNIRERAFRNCENIQYVGCFASQPPFAANNSFASETYKSALLEVGPNKRFLYMQVPPWSNFLNVEELSAEAVKVNAPASDEFSFEFKDGSLAVRGAEGEMAIYSLAGLNVFSGRKGEGEIEVPLPDKGVYVLVLNNCAHKVIIR